MNGVLWIVLGVSLPYILAARNPVPISVLMLALLVFIAVWLLRARSNEEGGTNRKVMGIDRVGIMLLAGFGAYLSIFWLALAFGAPWMWWVLIPAPIAILLIVYIVKATLDVRKRREVAHRSEPTPLDQTEKP